MYGAGCRVQGAGFRVSSFRFQVCGLGLRAQGFLQERVKCVRETEILVEQQPPQGVFVCDHAGLVINKFSRGEVHHTVVENTKGGSAADPPRI